MKSLPREHGIILGSWSGLGWKGSQGSSPSTPCPRQGHLLIDLQPGLGHLQGWGSHNFSVPGHLPTLPGKNVSLLCNLSLSSLQEVGWDKGIGSHEAEDESGLCTGDNFHFRTGKGPFVPTPGKLGQSNICLQLAGVPVGSGLSARRGCGGSRAEGTGAGAAPRAGAGLSGRGGAAGPGGLGLGGGARVLIGQRCQPAPRSWFPLVWRRVVLPAGRENGLGKLLHEPQLCRARQSVQHPFCCWESTRWMERIPRHLQAQGTHTTAIFLQPS
ncbi:uncharacterized protein LOC127463890 [Manacus candei]|uniref:uncharacterized protein LOC127463890 n=1 Tax=Manacus candei TaxID=415023 RepID=UPI0022261422|nr:uncharacterized protein LOC127463890 [Manacus candei]